MSIETLSHILNRTKERGFIAGFLVRGRGVGLEVSHLLFVDDTVILSDVRKEHIEHLSFRCLCLRQSHV